MGKAEQHLVWLGGLPQLGGVLSQLPSQVGQPLQVGVYLPPVGGAEEVPGLFGGGPGTFSFFCLAFHPIFVGEKQVLLFAGPAQVRGQVGFHAAFGGVDFQAGENGQRFHLFPGLLALLCL